MKTSTENSLFVSGAPKSTLDVTPSYGVDMTACFVNHQAHCRFWTDLHAFFTKCHFYKNLLFLGADLENVDG